MALRRGELGRNYPAICHMLQRWYSLDMVLPWCYPSHPTGWCDLFICFCRGYSSISENEAIDAAAHVQTKFKVAETFLGIPVNWRVSQEYNYTAASRSALAPGAVTFSPGWKAQGHHVRTLFVLIALSEKS
jgi:hypothetical protein